MKAAYMIRIACLVPALFASAAALAAGVSVIPDAAFSGDRGMRVLMNNTDPGFVEDGSPNAIQRYFARFWVNLDSVDLGTAEEFDILHGLNNADEIQFRLRVRRVSGTNRLNVFVRLDNGTTLEMDPGDEPLLPGGWNSIEIEWRTATAPGQNNGYVFLFVNRNFLQAYNGIDTDQRQLDKVRLGFVELATSGQVGGSFDIDEFVSRTNAPIGDSPTTTGLADVSVLVGSLPTAIDLFAAFADTEDADNQLAYTVTAVSNPALFADYEANATTGTLTLTYSGEQGTSDMTVRVFDTSSLFVETTFTVTVSPPPPGVATGPVPADSADDVDVDQKLSWTAGDGAASHDVYFGTSSPPPFVQNQAGTSFDPGALEQGTTYFWRIDEVNLVDTTEGPVWSFTTKAGILGDVDGNGSVNAVDIQLVINVVLGITMNPAADINGDNVINAVDIQLVINIVLGLPV